MCKSEVCIAYTLLKSSYITTYCSSYALLSFSTSWVLRIHLEKQIFLAVIINFGTVRERTPRQRALACYDLNTLFWLQLENKAHRHIIHPLEPQKPKQRVLLSA